MADASVERKAKKRGGRVPILTASEKKRRKKQYDQKLAKSRVYIGSTVERWKSLKSRINAKTDEELASTLIERYETSVLPSFKQPQAITTQDSPTSSATFLKTSTPGSAFNIASLSKPSQSTPSVSEISAESEIEPMSGIEEIQGSSAEDTGRKVEKLEKTATHRTRKPIALSASFCDPFNLSIDISMHEEELDADDDPDYHPSFDITAMLPDDVNNNAEDVAFEEAEFGFEVPGNDGFLEGPDIEMDVPVGIKKITSEDECRELAGATKCIAFVKQIRDLLSINISQCKEQSCQKPTRIVESFVGSAMYLKWVCDEKHVSHQWCSQPQLNRRLHCGDFLICGTILSSGNNYGKMALWAEMLSLKFPSADQFHRICSTYIIPSIDNFWTDHRDDLLQDLQDKDVVVLGDGRNDSPGHSAQYCSYTLMDNDTKKILTVHTIDKWMTERKSTNMEKAGFQAALNELLEKNINVREVVTDAHLGIGSVMKTQYPGIYHSHDIWHVAKNLGKKILKVAQKKGNGILLDWSKDIVNHFWFSCREANTYEEFVSIWRSVLHHITNKHEWILSHGGVNHCLHGELGEEERTKPWLSPSEHAHVLKDLATIVLDKRLLNNVGYYLKFRSTAELEGFHQHLLMYCSKRFAYSPPVYRARNRLAALDHNMNVERPVQKNKDGTIRYHRVFNKKSGRWTVHPVKTRKQYQYIQTLLTSALIMRINDRVGMKMTALAPDDPRLISKHLAPIEPPPTEELVRQQKSRFPE